MCSSLYTVPIILFSPLIGSHVHVHVPQVYITHTSITKCDILQCKLEGGVTVLWDSQDYTL